MVRVRAVVMTRDDSSGGWVPMGGGGLSHVMICKVRHPEEGRHRQYLISGERLRDQTTILECTLKRDLVYNKVNPIFHHWKVGDNKFGLTFQSPADAVAFERGVQTALEEIAEGSLSPSSTSSSCQDEAEGKDEALAVHTDSESSSNSQKEMLPKPITIVTSESSSSCYMRSPVSEEFSFSTPKGAGSAGSQAQPQPLQQLTLPDEEELESITPCRDLWVTKGYEDYRRAVVQKHQPDPDKIDMCVHFKKGGGSGKSSREKEYSFPPGAEGRLKDPKASPSCRIHDVPSPPKHKPLKEQQQPSPLGAAGLEEDTVPSRCVYCRDVFNNEENGRGQCQDAPDPIGRCVYQFTCMWCAESMLYHCMSDSEGEYSDPCSCDTGHPHFCIRWMALVTLSLVVPCMCCYLPLHACHWCGEHCGCCGGKHKAVR
ncbi:sprouty-related, EVH1 domain-containing protein 3 isoform X2 [Sceloporus undulatus]|nr:sprouty-related, EVH1 domain-containing protein 3 isoform X2 [Sceloporus undulatus]XP_042295026.1 sprouty-related, EVH1 domain-containing protein 3 isoform X2 [Sceloporus undulatus]XP_042295027.1 sprouty-related, EVH1 domain-containing protein 3 isoform X2 [Sceloporus undulatus]XP_042295028.1 sprouty-related, EVH1 domain-containing protein 3 isoform X2 [Sceloporus undulatus]